jgi:hypothetical protein
VIDPTEADFGRRVIYRERGSPPDPVVEEGVITSFNDTSVFVRYGANTGSAATRREDLTWL